MMRKLLKTIEDEKKPQSEKPTPAPEDEPEDAFEQRYCFFYGTLMDPATLARVLGLPDLPKLRPAKLAGYHTKLWGPYPAPLDDEHHREVTGKAYLV